MRKLALLAVCILQIALSVQATGQYTVIGPGTIHSGRKYNVGVGVHHNTEPATLKVGITGPLYNETKTVELQANELKEITFDVPCLESSEHGDYNLTAEGVAGIIFQNTTKLNYADVSANVKIQTDKGNYKPGDVVNYRVLFLNENLRPDKPADNAAISFLDAKSNIIKVIKNFEVVNGVFTDKFQISEFPALGNWRVVVKNGNSYDTSAYFDVSKYVLPKYDVKVVATDRVSVRDGDLQIVVRSNYTYGKPVNGKVTVLIELSTYYGYSMDDKVKRNPPVLIKTADMVNGKSKFDLNVKEYADYLTSKTGTSYLSITATVEENFTGVKINGTTGSTLYPYRYSMNCVSYSTCSSFEADKEHDVIFQITLVDETHVQDTKSPVTLTYTEDLTKLHYWRGMEEADSTETTTVKPEIEHRTFVFESHMNATGHAIFKVTLPELTEYEGYYHFFNLEAAYLDEKQKIFSTYQYRKPKVVDLPENEEPKDYFKIEQARLPDNRYQLKQGEEITLTINSSVPLTYFVYHLIGRGNILESARIELPDKPKTYAFKLQTTFLLAPYGKFYAYYVDEHGELHYAEASFSIEVELQNKIEIIAPEQVKPGEDVALRIKTAPNSFVGLLAVDQSVLLLGSNNDIGPHDFTWRLGSYSTYTPYQGGFSPYPGQQSGVVTLTNADYFYNRTAPVYGGIVPFAAAHGDINRKSGVQHITTQVMHAEAMPAAPAAGGFSGGGAPAVRKDFSETWLFDNINSTSTEEFTWSKKIPDTITSWVLTAFSLNPDKGIGITENKTNIKTFQPFFVSIRLPYSVKRGEVINIPALVFNYLEKNLDVEVTLENPDNEFEFISNEIDAPQKVSKIVRVPANDAAGVSFLLRPKIVGNMLLKFTAISPIAGDAVHKTLKVVPEGVTEYANRAYLINLKDAHEYRDTFELALPTEVVPDSQHIEFAVVGDLLGPLLNNLDNLVRLPSGCGEQTTSKLVPNYLVLRYLKTLNKLTPALESRIKRNLESGYQNLLGFSNTDGSFGSFPPLKKSEKPHNGSTWLTAYIVRSLNQAKDHIKIDKKILEEGLKFLTTKQAENGSFVESGDYSFGSQRNHITLTARVLLAFVEYDSDTAATYQSNIDNGFKYILENLDKTDDLQAKALATYALHKAKHPAAIERLRALETLAKKEDGRTWWSQRSDESSKYWWRWSYSNDVEITSYILLTLLDVDSENIDNILPIIKWLVAQRNSYGGFASTQDTVVGLQALIKFAEKSGYKAAIGDVSFTAKGGSEKQYTIKVNEENGLILQSVELPQKTTAIDFQVEGTGTALVQISYQYNILEKEQLPSFAINTIINSNTPPHKLELSVCVEYQGKGQASNMAVLEIQLPSGYIADEESFEHINEIDRVRQTETKNGETLIVVYFESLAKGETKCIPVEAFKSFMVALQKPASIVLYDYYETDQKATAYYEVSSKVCDVCEDDEECKKVCNKV